MKTSFRDEWTPLKSGTRKPNLKAAVLVSTTYVKRRYRPLLTLGGVAVAVEEQSAEGLAGDVPGLTRSQVRKLRDRQPWVLVCSVWVPGRSRHTSLIPTPLYKCPSSCIMY